MPEPACRIYLILPPAIDAATAAILPQVLDAGDVACVLLWLDGGDAADWESAAGVIIPLAHAKGIPVLAGGAHLARFASADGIHVDGDIEAVKAAHAINAPRRMVGAGGLSSRDDAMRAGDAGVDYVMFGSADPAGRRRVPFPRVLELTGWWADIFQVPCVAVADSLEEARTLAAAGADFVAVGGCVWWHPAGAANAVRELAQALAKIEATA